MYVHELNEVLTEAIVHLDREEAFEELSASAAAPSSPDEESTLRVSGDVNAHGSDAADATNMRRQMLTEERSKLRTRLLLALEQVEHTADDELLEPSWTHQKPNHSENETQELNPEETEEAADEGTLARMMRILSAFATLICLVVPVLGYRHLDDLPAIYLGIMGKFDMYKSKLFRSSTAEVTRKMMTRKMSLNVILGLDGVQGPHAKDVSTLRDLLVDC